MTGRYQRSNLIWSEAMSIKQLAIFVLAVGLAGSVTPASAASSFLVNGGHDPAIAQLGTIFGGLFAGGTGTTVLTTFCKLLNTVVLGVAGTFFMWQLATGVIQSAHDGEMLGRQWSSLWVPIRFLCAGAAMVPVASGYCVMQSIIADGVTLGVDAGGWIWSQTMTKMLTGGTPISITVSPSFQDLARGIWQMEVCRWEIDLMTDGSTAWPRETALTAPTSQSYSSGSATPRWSPVATSAHADLTDACGWITLAPPPTSANFGPIIQSHVTNTNTLITSLDGLAKRLVTGTRTGASDAERSNIPAVSDIASAISTAESALVASTQTAIAQVQQNSAATAKSMAAINAGGWMFAGTWYNTIAAQNSAYADAINAHPAYRAGENIRALHAWGNDDEIDKIGIAATDLIDKSVSPDAKLASWRPASGAIYADSSSKDGKNAKGKATPEDGGGRFASIVTSYLNKFAAQLQQMVSGAWATTSLSSSTMSDPLGTLVCFGLALQAITMSIIAALAVAAAAAGATVIGGTGLMSALLTPIGGDLSFILNGLAILGGFLGHVLPMLPYLIWTLTMISYLALAAEAIIAAPVWCFAHLKAGGEGIHGQAGSGYSIIFNILLYPSLMVGGLIAGMALTTLGVAVVNVTFGAALADSLAGVSTTQQSIQAAGLGGLLSILAGWLIRLAIYVGLVIVICERSFALIHVLPEKVMRWAGASGETIDHSAANTMRGYALAAVTSGRGRMGMSSSSPAGGAGQDPDDATETGNVSLRRTANADAADIKIGEAKPTESIPTDTKDEGI